MDDLSFLETFKGTSGGFFKDASNFFGDLGSAYFDNC